jgi:Putative transposase
VPYFPLVFTVPAAIAGLALQNKAVVYDILFQAAAETVRTLAADPKHLGAAIGMTAVLHTWRQNLFHHPHIHCIVPGGGLSPEGRWIACRPGFFLPVRVLLPPLPPTVPGTAGGGLRYRTLGFFGELAGLAKPAGFAAHLRPLRGIEWVVYAKRPFGGPQQVLDYLGRYTHRVAIANRRLIALAGGQVRFRWKDYRHPQRPKVMTLPVGEFIRRFLLHVLPDGFRRIRHFGFLANAHRRVKLVPIRGLLALLEPETAPKPADYRERYARLVGRSLDICPACGGHLFEIAVLERAARSAPPPFFCDSS